MWEDKETTAPIPSVAPDGEQPSAFARTVSITEIEETRKQFGKIQIMTMPELMETRFRVRPAVIDGLLPVGTYLLAGAPKIGKSFLVLQMAYQVSMGAPFLGFSSRQGTVLYLALEDTCERLQKRLAQMTEQDSEHLILSVFSETLNEGLTERLSDFWSEHTDTVLIIIDTLQRVRSRTPDGGSYAADYDTLARLKEFSDTFGVTVLIVHHTRKEGAEDVFNMISGTNGLMGAADGALLLHKDIRVTVNECKRAFLSPWKRTEPIEDYAEQLAFKTPEHSELFHAVMALPQKYRVPLFLHYYEGYSCEEISKFLGIPNATVRTRLRRGREQLKTDLQEANNDV